MLNDSKLTGQEAIAKIKELKMAALILIEEAEALAKAHKLDFTIDLAYGMGGWYDGIEGEWNPSSQSC